jgi:hypothetical protein
MTWHTDPETLDRYGRGSLSASSCSSVEAHLLSCETCRDEVSDLVPPEDVDQMWQSIAAEVAAPRAGVLERLLTRLGVPDHVACLVGITPSLRGPWLVGVAAALGFAVLLAYGSASGSAGLFVLVAPLLPVAGVAASFGTGADPTHELVAAAPIRSFDLLMARTVAVLATTLPLAALASFALPAHGWSAAVWLLPALALTSATLATGTWVALWKAASVLAGAWVAVAAVLALRITPDQSLTTVLGRPAGQMVMCAVLLIGAAVLYARRDVLDVGEIR